MVRPRVASLLPAATEMIVAVGGRDRLVGISHECDHPSGLGAPVLTRARLGPVGGSRSIDAEVRRLLENALSIYQVDVQALERARPDLVVTQDLCRVCAVSPENLASALASLPSTPTLLSLSPEKLSDILADVKRVAEAMGLTGPGAEVVSELERRIDVVAVRARTLPDRPRVLSIEWLAPVMIGGLWMPELIDLAGGDPLVTRAGEHAPTLDRRALEALEPEVVLIKPCGYALGRTLEELSLIHEALPLELWRSKADLRVYVADGNAFFNRPGPRIVESLEILATSIHPGAFADLGRAHRHALTRLDLARDLL